MAIGTLGYALLGLLARAPQSGYELAQRMHEPVGFFWWTRHSQIYPELARLEAAELVTHEVVPQQDRPAKKVYTPTDAGLAALRAWVTAATELGAIRDELVLKAYSVWLAEPAAAAALFREQERLHRDRLAEYDRFREEMEQRWHERLTRPDTPEWATYATLRRGLGYEQATAARCGWMAEALEGASGTGTSPDNGDSATE